MRQDKLNKEEEFKAYEEDMLKSSHKGEFCWLTGKTCCQEGYCQSCQLYLDWKESLRKVSAE